MDRNVVIGIRFSKSERLKLQTEADKKCIPLSTLIRMLLKKSKLI